MVEEKIGDIKNGIMKYRGDIEKKSTFFPEIERANKNIFLRTSYFVSRIVYY